MGCRVWGAGVSLQGLRYAVCKAEGMYKGCEDADCRVYGTGCMAQGVGCERSMKFWNFSVSLCRFRVFTPALLSFEFCYWMIRY